MDALLAFALALSLREAAPREELRFAYARKQEGEMGCGLAAAASFLELYCSSPADEAGLEARLASSGQGRQPGRGISLADLAFLLGAAGLRCRAYRMDRGQLEAALGSGFAPIVAHYERPSGHFALVLARAPPLGGRGYLCLADPARGIEALSSEDFLGRWSGAALLVDPAGLSTEGRERLAAAARTCGERLALLARGEALRLALRAALSAGAAAPAARP